MGMKKQKLFKKLLDGSKNIQFLEIVECAELFEFRLARISGSHHIYMHPDIPNLINLQDIDGKAKPY
jgi:hypothetical protein